MSFDLSWLWSWLNNVAPTINSWIQSIINGVQQITQLPQAIVSGLIAFGSAIWDGLQKIGSWFYNAFQWIANGFRQLGEWLWNGLVWVANTIYNALKSVWNVIISFIEYIWNSIVNAFETFRTAINNWFVGILIRTRQKIKQQIVFSLTTYFTWKYGEKVINDGNWRKLIGLPFVFLGSMFGSYLLAEIIDRLIPNIQGGSFDLIPPVQLPQISLQRMAELQQQLTYTIQTNLPKTILLPQTAGQQQQQQQQTTSVMAKLPMAIMSIQGGQQLSTTITAKLPNMPLTTSVGQQLTLTVIDKLPKTLVSTTAPTVVQQPSSVNIAIGLPSLGIAGMPTMGGSPQQPTSVNITLKLPSISTGNKPLSNTDITVKLPSTSNTTSLQ